MSKSKSRRKKPNDSSDTYSPGGSKEEKAARHRLAVKKHYASHPEIRVQRQAEMAEKRAEKSRMKKLQKRRWDHPKPVPKPLVAHGDPLESTRSVSTGDIATGVAPVDEESNFSFHFPQYTFQDPRALSVHRDDLESGRYVPSVPRALIAAPSLMSHERMATEALAQLAAGVVRNALIDIPGRSASADSILAKANQLSDLGKQDALAALDGGRSLDPHVCRVILDACATINPHHLPAGVTPLSQEQRSKAETELVFTRPQAVQIYLALLNTGEGAPPTAEQQLHWRRVNNLGGQYVTYSQERTLNTWRWHVSDELEEQQRAQELRALSGPIVV
ncbi:hypothetical protein B0H17DRAFT_1133501 [Mycena rosella]|uniref:Uncharacterized protein n=1 Tax=Mycena rosella TaxID=1033263 RepID=A0AAD7DHW7_MYCRO|nr:hypothetical protein B0H17DRAFT_1133501 [Mycena rosella]